MKFKSSLGKMVRIGSHKLVIFKGDFYSTNDQAEINALLKAKGVVKVDAKKAKKESKA